MKIIGITGGIGSGKTLVTKLLEEEGAYIANTDRIAKELMEPGKASYIDVVEYFGKGILLEDKTIDSNKLSKIVFKDEMKLKKLNSLTHPKVLEVVKEEIEEKKKEEWKYFVIETALMIESGYDIICDQVWYVYAPEKMRRDRLKKSRAYSDLKIDSIFESQSKDEDFRRRYPIVIENVGDLDYLQKQVERLIN